MADVLLRESVEQMRGHLQAGHYSAALALGQHILHFYPKHIETYTVLAQVSLASNDLAGANDLLRRVLSADPENVIALAGMALISETQEKHDEALWYLERAYEIQPSNDELRAELLRVREMFYGAAPSRIELTSGALARVYARQGQYAQAINEFRRLLRNDSKRYDARVGLAETLYRAGRTDESAQIAQAVMADAPFALKPNLILGALWTENAVPEGQQFLQRAHQLDPEHRVARDLLGERFDGSQAPRLPALGEVAEPTRVEPEAAGADIFAGDVETSRAAQIWSEIERAQEVEPSVEEPLRADLEALERVEREPEPAAPIAEQIFVEPMVEPPPSIDLAARLSAVSEPAPEISSTPTSDATLQEILQAEQANAQQKAPPAPSIEQTAPTEPKPPTKIAERLGRGKSGEGIATDAIAAAAAALASSIALDKSNQPSPTRRAHPAIPKVRPVIRSAQDKLPNWLYITATPSNAPASFDAPPPSTAEQVAPLPTPKEDRPAWLVEAQAASVESETPRLDSALPDWLKPPVAAEPAPPTRETTPPKDVPSWLREEPPAEAPRVMETAPVAEQPTVVALPEWLQDQEQSAPPVAPAPQEAPVVAEGWTNAPQEKTIAEPIWKQVIEQEPPFVRQEETRETISVTDSPTEIPFAQEALSAEIVHETFVESSAAVETSPVIEQTPVVETTIAPETPAPVEEPAPLPTQVMPDSATMLQMARDKRAGGDLKGALDLYERVMHRRPNHLDQVTLDLQEIVQAGGAPTTANRLLGEAFAMAGRFKESLEQYRIAMGK